MISLPSRLTELFSLLWEEFIQYHSTAKNLNTLIKEIAQTRNDLSHGNDTEAGDLQKQRNMVDLMSQTLRILLLQRLGWPVKDAIQIVSEHPVSQNLSAWVTANRSELQAESAVPHMPDSTDLMQFPNLAASPAALEVVAAALAAGEARLDWRNGTAWYVNPLFGPDVPVSHLVYDADLGLTVQAP